jgi:2-hydroxychromene-2-carboxylate isomerase
MPSKFPIGTTAPARAFYAVADSDPAAAKRLASALYGAYFAEDRDISSPEVTAHVAHSLGLEGIAQALDDVTIKDRLRREVDAAVARGVFGSPYIVVDGEPFWGSDRLDQIDKWLASGGW